MMLLRFDVSGNDQLDLDTRVGRILDAFVLEAKGSWELVSMDVKPQVMSWNTEIPALWEAEVVAKVT